MFSAFFTLGLQHIADLAGYDHILFIVALCAAYPPSNWKRVVWLVTAFTLGHSLTLALAALNLVNIQTAWVEFLIPVTILFTSIWNIITYRWQNQKPLYLYLLASFFGLIHGLGFSNYLRSLLLPGEKKEFVIQLLAFNLGVEAGQLLIVSCFFMVSLLFIRGLRVAHRDWLLFVSGAAAGLSLVMALERVGGL